MKRSAHASRRKASPSRVAPQARRTSTKKRRARGGTKRKAYATFDLYLAGQLPRNQRTIRALRRFVRKVAPKLEESVKWGSGCWLKAETPVCYVDATPAYVRFGFLRGVSLSDPRGLLAGLGKHVRHITIHRLADIDEKALAALLRQAIA